MPPTMTTDRSAPATRGDLDAFKTQLRREIRAEVEAALASWPVREQRRNDIKEALTNWPVRRERRNDVEEVLGSWGMRQQRRDDIEKVLGSWQMRNERRKDIRSELRDWSGTVLFYVGTAVAAILIVVSVLLLAGSGALPDESDGMPPAHATESTPTAVVEPAPTSVAMIGGRQDS